MYVEKKTTDNPSFITIIVIKTFSLCVRDHFYYSHLFYTAELFDGDKYVSICFTEGHLDLIIKCCASRFQAELMIQKSLFP